MQHKRLHESGGQRTYVVVLETGEEVMGCLQRFVSAERVHAAQLTAIGAFSDVVLSYFDWDKKDYARIPGARAGRSCFAHWRRGAGALRRAGAACSRCRRQA